MIMQPFEYSKEFRVRIERLAAPKKHWPNYDRYVEDSLGGPHSRLVEFGTELIPEISFRCGSLQKKRVLDFGCGTGATTVPLAAECNEVVAFDVDVERVEICRKRLEEHGLQHRVDCRAALDLDEIRNEIGLFDLVLMNGVIEHIPRSREGIRRRIVRSVFELLRPGGHLVINDTPNRLCPYDFHTTQLWWIPWSRPGSVRSYRRALAKKRFLEDGGFSPGPLGLEEAGAWGATYWEIKSYLRGLPFECVNMRPGHSRHLRYRPARKNSKRDWFELWVFVTAVQLCRAPLTAFTPSLTNLVLERTA